MQSFYFLFIVYVVYCKRSPPIAWPSLNSSFLVLLCFKAPPYLSCIYLLKGFVLSYCGPHMSHGSTIFYINKGSLYFCFVGSHTTWSSMSSHICLFSLFGWGPQTTSFFVSQASITTSNIYLPFVYLITQSRSAFLRVYI